MGATLHGILDNDGYSVCQVRFDWGPTPAMGNFTAWQNGFTSGMSFSQAITGLLAHTDYYFRAQAQNIAGLSSGAVLSFHTNLGDEAVVVTQEEEYLNGLIKLNGKLTFDGNEPCSCGFQWGPTAPAYGNTTAVTIQTTDEEFTQNISGVTPGTYHYRAFATNATGTSYGVDRTFIASGGLLAVRTNNPVSLGVMSGTLIDDGGAVLCQVAFEYGTSLSYGSQTPWIKAVTGTNFTGVMSGLLPATTYHYRAIARNGTATSSGADVSFTAPANIPQLIIGLPTARGVNEVTLNATLTADGGEPCYCGFIFAQSGAQLPVELSQCGRTATQTKTAGQQFGIVVADLVPGTVYYFQAFATNSAGTVYSDASFTTTITPFAYSYNTRDKEILR